MPGIIRRRTGDGSIAVEHGHTVGPTGRSPTYISWQNMRSRCRNRSVQSYPNYGGRGISICARWASFPNFLADMGERPAGTTLDRINNDGDYEPGNCRWADRRTQINNRPKKPLTPIQIANLAHGRAVRRTRIGR